VLPEDMNHHVVLPSAQAFERSLVDAVYESCIRRMSRNLHMSGRRRQLLLLPWGLILSHLLRQCSLMMPGGCRLCGLRTARLGPYLATVSSLVCICARQARPVCPMQRQGFPTLVQCRLCILRDGKNTTYSLDLIGCSRTSTCVSRRLNF